MILIKNFFKIFFGIDPRLAEAEERTNRIKKHMDAVVNGDRTWMMTCRPVDADNHDKIECDNGGVYKKNLKWILR